MSSLRKVPKHELLARAASLNEERAIIDILDHLCSRRPRSGCDLLAPLLRHPSPEVLVSLALVLASFREVGAIAMLEALARHPDPTVRETAATVLGWEQAPDHIPGQDPPVNDPPTTSRAGLVPTIREYLFTIAANLDLSYFTCYL